MMLRAASIIQVKPDFAQIIRESNLAPKYNNFNSDTHTISILDAHNAFILYVRDILPTKNQLCRLENGSYQCCEIMQRLLHHDSFDPLNLELKWRMLVRQITLLDGARIGHNLQNNRNAPAG